ncbi:MAG: DNA-binding protein YbiB [Zoogloeaceae bacterium]|nr:DNA-binding protein YbiB [Zoogloeaceae bacterium]
MKFAPFIKEIGRGAKGAAPLGVDQAEALFGAMLDGEVPDLELGAIVLSMRIKGETSAELRGFMAALQARTPQLAVPAGPRCVVLPTYNGARRQPNLMPLVALLLVKEGVPVLIQGRHDFDARVSPFALLAALEIHPAADLAGVEGQLREGGLACVKLDLLVPGLARLLALRPRLGLRNSGHTVAKLIDPCLGRSVRVVAVTHPEYLERMHIHLCSDSSSALLLRGTEGEAYANPRRCPRLEGFHHGEAMVLAEAAEGGAPPIPGFPDSPSVEDNVACIRRMLGGELPIPEPILIQVRALKHLACQP